VADSSRAASPKTTWTVYLFSDTGKVLFEKDFQARDPRDADRQGLRLVKPHLDKHDDAEDWVVEETPAKRASTDPSEELAIRFLLAEDAIEQDGRAKLGAKSGEKVTKIPKRIQKALDASRIKAESGYFSDGNTFTAHLKGKVVAVLDYDQGSKTWSVRSKGKKAKSNAKIVEVPNTFHAVKVEPPKAKRKEFPFEGYIDFQGLQIDVENVKGGTRKGKNEETGDEWSTFVRRVARRYMVAKGFDVPFSTSKVVVEPPRKKRKEYPFEGFIQFQGLSIHVENVKGSTREGVDPDGTPWKVTMKHHYGEVDQTEGVDHDPVDIYVGPNGDSPLVVVVRQQDPKTKKYDEDKVMVGFDTEDEAIKAYKAQYNSAGFYQSHKSMPIGRFLRWCLDKDNKGKKVSRLNGGSCSGRAG